MSVGEAGDTVVQPDCPDGGGKGRGWGGSMEGPGWASWEGEGALVQCPGPKGVYGSGPAGPPSSGPRTPGGFP